VHYEAQGGVAAAAGSGPAVASRASNRLDVFVRGVDNKLYWKTWNGSDWSMWGTIGAPPGGVTSDPAAVSMGPNDIELFVRGADNACWQRSYSSGSWSGWGSLGGALTTAPSVSSRGVGELDVFAGGPGNWIWEISLDTGVSPTWGDWHDAIDIPIAYAPAAVSWNNTDVDLFFVDVSNKMWHTWYNGVKWSIPEDLGGYCVSGPGTAANLAANRIDVFVRGPFDLLYQRTYSAISGWDADWAPLSGTIQFQGDPDAVSWGPNRIDLFGVGSDSILYHKAWVAGVWLP